MGGLKEIWDVAVYPERPISVGFRTQTYKIFSSPALRPFAQQYYSMGKACLVRQFKQLAEEIYFKHNPTINPGVSDIDFLLVLEELNSENLACVRNKYFQLKRFFPMLGELAVSTASIRENYIKHSPASSLGIERQRVVSEGRSRLIEIDTSNASLESRFWRACHHYNQAFEIYRCFVQSKSILEKRLVHKHLSKSSICLGSDYEEENLEKYFESVLYGIDQIAERILEMPVLQNIDFVCEAENLPESVKDAMLRSLHKGNLRDLGLQEKVGLQEDPRIGVLKNLLVFPEALKKLSLLPMSAPLLVSESIYECFKLGLGMGFVGEHLKYSTRVPSSKLRYCSYQNTLERAAIHSFLLPSLLLIGSAKLNSVLEQFCLEKASLEDNKLYTTIELLSTDRQPPASLGVGTLNRLIEESLVVQNCPTA